MNNKKTILILCDWFLPGCLAGGPIQSIATITHHLKDEFNFKIITTDRDFKSPTPYSAVALNTWTNYLGREVFYISPENLTEPFLLALLQNTPHDVLYLNSLFSKPFAIQPLRWKQKGLITSQVVLAPRGMFGQKALAFKPLKKKLFLLYAQCVSLFKNISWHSTSAQETKDITKHIGSTIKLIEINNLPHIACNTTQITKQAGTLRLCFIGRIQAIKNLDVAINALIPITEGNIAFDVYGPKEDEGYWNSCESIAKQLPQNINFNYKGILQPQEISKTISAYHALLLPTQTENFGHVIVETLLQARPVIISNNTPWQQLAKHQAGFDIDLTEPKKITDAINHLLTLNDSDYQMMSKASLNFINTQLCIDETKQKYIELFNSTT